jgi:hypothetical protein
MPFSSRCDGYRYRSRLDGVRQGRCPERAPEDGAAMGCDCIGMSNTHRFTVALYDSFPASEWASPRFVMVSPLDLPILVQYAQTGQRKRSV